MAIQLRTSVHRRGLTVLELIVVLVICILALGLGAMAIARHRENALRIVCQNNLRVQGAAILAYHGQANEKKARLVLPPSRIAEDYATWAVLIAPHMLADHPLNLWEAERSYFDQEKSVRESAIIQQFCPTRTRPDALSMRGDDNARGENFPGGLGDYAAVAGDGSADHDWTTANANGPFVMADVLARKGDRITQWHSRTTLESLTRGTSVTLLVGEKHVLSAHMGDANFGDGSLYNGQHPASFSRVAGPGFGLAPSIDAPMKKNFGSWHRGICNFLMADGAVRPTAIDINEDILGQLARRGK